MQKIANREKTSFDAAMEKASFNIELGFSEAELTTLINALNEVCNGPDALEDLEFQRRIGSDRSEVLSLTMRLLAKKQSFAT